MPGKFVAALLASLLAVSAAGANGEVYGTIRTESGQTLEGPIRWDRNECFWDDVLDAEKPLPPKPQQEEEGFKLSLFGLKIFDSESHYSSQGFSIPLGHLASLTRRDEGALLSLKNGERIEIDSAGSTDLGSSLREVVVEDLRKGRVALAWHELQRVDFRQSPGRDRDSARLHGTVETSGQSFTGFLVLDANQSLTTDSLEGDQDGTTQRVVLSDVREMRPLERAGTILVLKTGKSLTLNDEKEKILVAIDDLGHVDVPWVIVKRVTLSAAPASPSYDTFDGGKRIAGTLKMKDGRELTGLITWDRDETYTWETIDGRMDDIYYSIRFGEIRSIRRQSDFSSEVTLTDGRKLDLSGTNDVGDDNRGVLVRSSDGTETELAWRDAHVLELK